MLDNINSTNTSVWSSEAQEMEPLMSKEGYIVAAVAIFFIGFLGFSFNLMVLIQIGLNKKLWTPINMILFNLVLSDFLMSILGIPWTFISSVYNEWVFGKIGCVLYGFTMSFLGLTSISSLTVLAFERYMMISQMFRNRTLSHCEAAFMIAGTWMYSLCMSLPPLFGWGEYINEAANISCSINWEKKSFNSMTYIMYLFTFGLFVPIVIITFSYAKIILTMKQGTFRDGKVTKAERKVTVMIFVMIIAFLVAWAPYAILALIVQFGNPSLITPAMGVFPALLAKSSICYNPIIYVALNSQIRKSSKLGFLAKQKRRTSVCETYDCGTSSEGNKDKKKGLKLKSNVTILDIATDEV